MTFSVSPPPSTAVFSAAALSWLSPACVASSVLSLLSSCTAAAGSLAAEPDPELFPQPARAVIPMAAHNKILTTFFFIFLSHLYALSRTQIREAEHLSFSQPHLLFPDIFILAKLLFRNCIVFLDSLLNFWKSGLNRCYQGNCRPHNFIIYLQPPSEYGKLKLLLIFIRRICRLFPYQYKI